MSYYYAIIGKGVYVNTLKPLLKDEEMCDISPYTVFLEEAKDINVLNLLYSPIDIILHVYTEDDDILLDSFGRKTSSKVMVMEKLSKFKFIAWYIDTFGLEASNLDVTDIINNIHKFSQSWVDKSISLGLLDMYKVSGAKTLPVQFVKRNEHRMIWEIAYASIPMSEVALEYFFSKYHNDAQALALSYNQKLSEKFIDKYKHLVYWPAICKCQVLSEEFIISHKKYVDWDAISEHQKLSLEFIVLNNRDINWYLLFKNPSIDDEIKIELGRQLIIKTKKYTEVIEKCLEAKQ